MTTLRVVHISPIPAALTPIFIERREAELRRIFGQSVQVIFLSGVSVEPSELARRTRAAQPDAVVLASAVPRHRRAIQQISHDTLILRPVTERYRDHHGYPRERFIGFGVLREHGPELVGDGALTDRSMIVEELATQQALQARER